MQNIMTKKEYQEYVNKISPNSKILRNTVRAFVVGGLICVVGQFFTNAFKARGLDETSVAGLTAMVMIFLGALLTGLNIYDEIGRFAGAGSIIPITGFANSIVAPAMEFKSEGYVTGVGAKMFVISGPVLVYGITVSVIAGILHYLLRF